MWTRTYKKTFKNIKKEHIWNIWTDVNNWPNWHEDLDSCQMEGPFSVGSHFMLKPKGIKPVKIDLIDIEEGRSFTDCTSFFGAKMYDTHEMKEVKNGVELTNTLRVTGPLKWIWIQLVARKVADTVPQEMEALVKLARSYEK